MLGTAMSGLWCCVGYVVCVLYVTSHIRTYWGILCCKIAYVDSSGDFCLVCLVCLPLCLVCVVCPVVSGVKLCVAAHFSSDKSIAAVTRERKLRGVRVKRTFRRITGYRPAYERKARTPALIGHSTS